jgi:hypothetical protein
VKEAVRLSPRDKDAFVWMVIAGIAKLHLGADDEAVALAHRATIRLI